ncbi:MAG: hypothetical protein JO165_00955, partial [Candidatus Eremiobacteraeota bacterium]|nr:hypothetical protein [Candidatus Eremiobacteraeota bacterium]
MKRRTQLAFLFLLLGIFVQSARANTYSWFYSDLERSTIVTPGHALRFHYWTYDGPNREPIHVRLYRLTSDQVMEALGPRYAEPSEAVIRQGEYLRGLDSVQDRSN